MPHLLAYLREAIRPYLERNRTDPRVTRPNRPCLWTDPQTCLPCVEVSPDAYCPTHAKARDKQRRNPLYDDPRWRRLRKRAKARHIKRHGYLCPGWGREPHLAPDLHADHVVPVSMGGAPFEEANVQVLCGSCNDAKGTSSGRAGVQTGGGTP
jgi:5-methylcytosine-specific restriction enzyme A